MLIALLYMSMVSVGPNNFDGAKEKLARQILFLPYQMKLSCFLRP